MEVKEALEQYLEELKSYDARLVAVSKTKPSDLIREAYATGHRDFGENKVQELTAKAEELPKDIRWHMIGHLQTNKVKYIASFVHLIHAVDRMKLVKEINKQGKKIDRKIPVLLQVHIAREESKYGFNWEKLQQHLKEGAFEQYPYVQIKGLMGMATFTDEESRVRAEFEALKSYLDWCREEAPLDNAEWKELSMGMSNDYKIALETGTTMLRIGSAIFGARS